MPSTPKMDHEHFEEVKNVESVSTMIHNARRVLKQELQASCFTLLQLAYGPAVHVQTDGCQGYADQ
jgi:hypothetical protein